MPSPSNVVKFVRMLVSTRWPRYLVATIALPLAVLLSASALTWQRDVKYERGSITSVRRVNDSGTGAYQYDALVLSGSNRTYQVDVTAFTPSLAESQLQPGTDVQVWYIQPPFFEPGVVALQLPAGSAGTAAKYVTDAYVHPDRSTTSNLLLSGALAIVGLAALAAGRFLPASETDARAREKKERAKPRSYGAMVVGVPPSRRTSPR